MPGLLVLLPFKGEGLAGGEPPIAAGSGKTGEVGEVGSRSAAPFATSRDPPPRSDLAVGVGVVEAPAVLGEPVGDNETAIGVGAPRGPDVERAVMEEAWEFADDTGVPELGKSSKRVSSNDATGWWSETIRPEMPPRVTYLQRVTPTLECRTRSHQAGVLSWSYRVEPSMNL
mmetsp:Transcript_2261/g.5368  ORF Transcript_2261/g.5368 Transcript_2261/m.5368 type:complete len:172 (+) Transcript_2261:667-1182(+)